MDNRIRCFFLSAIVYIVAAFPATAQTETIINRPHHYTSSDIDRTGRYQIIQIASATNNIFRFDRICGDSELLVLNSNQVWVWQSTQVPDLSPCVNDSSSHYQLFGSAQGDVVILMNTDTKATWRFDVPHMAWVHM